MISFNYPKSKIQGLQVIGPVWRLERQRKWERVS